MKKLLSITLRLMLAAAGIGYIVWTLSWHDQVVVPVDYVFVDGTQARQEMSLRVLSEASDGGLILQGPGEGEQVRVPVSDMGLSDQSPQFKPGIVTTMGGANVGLLVAGFALILLLFPIQAYRWWLLMRCRGMDVPFARAMRLTMVGLFFNFCMPGMTGGDVVKAYYAAKGSGARGVAVMSVVFDRVAGLGGLVLLAGLAGLMMLWRGGLDAETLRLVQTVTVTIWLSFAAGVIGPVLFFSRYVRKKVGFDWLLGRLGPGHFLVRIDEMVSAYRDHKRVILTTVLLSLAAHLCQALATALAGYALGIRLPIELMLTVLPVIFLAGAVPLTYQGLGVMEALAMAMLLAPPMATANQLVSMLVLLRLFLILYALVGALLVLRGNIHLFPQIDDQDAEPDTEPGNLPASAPQGSV